MSSTVFMNIPPRNRRTVAVAVANVKSSETYDPRSTLTENILRRPPPLACPGQVSGDATFCTLEDILHTRKDRGGGVLIGKALPGVKLSIVGPDRTPVPAGRAGELLVGGVAVALGYHRRPRETAGKFLRSISAQQHQQHQQPAAEEESVGENVVHIPGLEPGRRVVCTGDRVVRPVDGGPLFWLGKLDGEVIKRSD